MYNKKNTFTGIKVDDLYAKGYIDTVNKG